MTDKQVKSWIFLSISVATQESPSDYEGISIIADGINHAVPTHKELQSSITYLLKNGLVEKNGNLYTLSNEGRSIMSKAANFNSTYLEIWKKLESLI